METLRCVFACLDFLLCGRDEVADHCFVSALDSLLSALLVDQVDEIVVSVKADLFIEMLSGGSDGCVDTSDLKLWGITEVVDFGPVDWNTASSLDMRKNLGSCLFEAGCGARITVADDDSLLGFVEVGSMSMFVNSASKVSCSGTVSGFASDEDVFECGVFDLGLNNLDESEDDGEDERVGLEVVSIPPLT